MSAEVSFTKRAAAELSRCFNGLTSANRTSNSTSNNSNLNNGACNSNSSTSSPSHSSPSSPSTAGKSRSPSASTTCTNSSSSSVHNHQHEEEETSETTLLLPASSSKQQQQHQASLSHDSSANNRMSLGNISILNTSSRNNRKADHTPQSSSSSSSLSSHISFHNSVQTLITKANTTLSPLTHRESTSTASPVKSNAILQQINCNTSNAPGTTITSHISNTTHTCTSVSSSNKQSTCISVKSPAKRSISTIARGAIAGVTSTPPTPPRKTSLARRKNFMLNLSKARTLEQLSKDTSFLSTFFNHFSPKERTVLAQVSRLFVCPVSLSFSLLVRLIFFKGYLCIFVGANFMPSRFIGNIQRSADVESHCFME